MRLRSCLRYCFFGGNQNRRIQSGRQDVAPTAATGFFRRGAGTLACLYSCSVSHVVQRVCFTSSSIIATTAWLVMRRSRGQ